MARYRFNDDSDFQNRINSSLGANGVINRNANTIYNQFETRYGRGFTPNSQGRSIENRTVRPSRVVRRKPVRKYRNVVKPANTDGEEYTIKAGDTLSGILKAKGINADWRSVAKANGIADGNRIVAGQKIKLPSTSNTESAKPEAAKPALPKNNGAAPKAGTNKPAVEKKDSVNAASRAERPPVAPVDTVGNAQRRDSTAVNVRDTINVQRPDTINAQRPDTLNIQQAATPPVADRRGGSRGSIRIPKDSVLEDGWLDYAIPTSMRTPGTASAYAGFGQYAQKVPTTPREGLSQLGNIVTGVLPTATGLGLRNLYAIARYGKNGVAIANRINQVNRMRKAMKAAEAAKKATNAANAGSATAANAGTSIGSRFRNGISNAWNRVNAVFDRWAPESGAADVRVPKGTAQGSWRVADTRTVGDKMRDGLNRLRSYAKNGYSHTPVKTKNYKVSSSPTPKRRNKSLNHATMIQRKGRTGIIVNRDGVSQRWRPRLENLEKAKRTTPKATPKAAEPATGSTNNGVFSRFKNIFTSKSKAASPKKTEVPKSSAERVVRREPESEPIILGSSKPAPKATPKATPKKGSNGSTAGNKSSSQRMAKRVARGTRKK